MEKTKSVVEYKGDVLEISDTPQEMAVKLNDMKTKLNLVQRFFKEVMIKDQDYGVIQGTEKPTLLKPGAEKLCELYGYAPVIKSIEEEKNIETGFYRARVTVALVHRRSGVTVAEGVGEANTMEGRYRWRWVSEWKLPEGVNKNGLYHEIRTDKNGKKYKMYRLENQDPWTLWNTVLKMAKKRALIDATLSATRSSGIFTQDVEDLAEWVEGAESITEDVVMGQHKNNQSIEVTKEESIEKQKISLAQAKRMFAIAQGDKDIVRQVLNKYGYEHSQDAIKEDYDKICAEIEQAVKQKAQEEEGPINTNFTVSEEDIPLPWENKSEAD
jgi:hypothetical protein